MTVARQLPAEDLEAPDEPSQFAGITGAHRLLADWMPVGSGLFDMNPQEPAVTPQTGPQLAPTDELSDIDLALSLAVTDRHRIGTSKTYVIVCVWPQHVLQPAQSVFVLRQLMRGWHDLKRFKDGIKPLLLADKVEPSPLRIGSLWSSLGGIGSRPVRPGVMTGGKPADGQNTWTPPDYVETNGRLATVVSRRPDAPRWAIVDINNNVLAFVTPSASVNLAPMVGQQITVRGGKRVYARVQAAVCGCV